MSYYNIVLWLDDVRDPEKCYKCGSRPNERIIWCHSVNEAIAAYVLWNNDKEYFNIAEINLDHDAGDYAKDGGDYIRFLDWMEKYHQDDIPNIEWKIHSMNPVGIQNMKIILQKNGAHIW